ncbi:MAG: ABC transporter substrate-binding protein [Hyphomicrobiaceae bacterium]|nr:ABC transporter substrate-binding protein [Hyphomicrobiaceae bacterium]
MTVFKWALSGVLAIAGLATGARAEVSEVVIAQQFGAVYLPAMVMEHVKLVEKHLAAAGMSDVKVKWAKLGGPAAINDATLAGSLHFACQGIPSLAVIADRTKGNIGVKSLGSMVNANIWLNTRNPTVKSLKDFGDKDRIAVPSLKVSTQAIMLHIAAQDLWGKGNHAKIDHLVVAVPHPDALAAVTNPSHELNSHFATTPFHEGEMKAGLRTVTTAYEIMGGPNTGLTFTSSEKFRKENPKVFAAVSKAFDESFEWINSDKRRAAKTYIEMTKEKRLTEDELTAVMNTKDLEYTKVPSRVMKMLDFLHGIGSLKSKPESWKDPFFPEVHALPGS